MKNRSVLATLLLCATSVCIASDATPVLDKRQENQERRVERGVESGQLNQREAARMERAEDRLERNEAKAKEDGKVTAAERRRLNREAKANSARIAKQKHDAQGDRTRDRKKPAGN